MRTSVRHCTPSHIKACTTPLFSNFHIPTTFTCIPHPSTNVSTLFLALHYRNASVPIAHIVLSFIVHLHSRFHVSQPPVSFFTRMFARRSALFPSTRASSLATLRKVSRNIPQGNHQDPAGRDLADQCFFTLLRTASFLHSTYTHTAGRGAAYDAAEGLTFRSKDLGLNPRSLCSRSTSNT
jgi:hypothetical protein